MNKSWEDISSLCRRLGVEELETNRYLRSHDEHIDVRRSLYYRRNREEFQDLEERFASQLSSPHHRRHLVTRHLGSSLGYGLFSLEPILSGSLIDEYLGVVCPARPGRPLDGGGNSSDYSWGFPRLRTLGTGMEIDARQAGGTLRFVNHRFQPNAIAEHFAVDGRWRLVFLALEDIPAGTEITVDYGEAYWAGGDRVLVLTDC